MKNNLSGNGEGEGEGILRDEKGRLLPGSRALNPSGAKPGKSRAAKLISACERECKKLGMTFWDYLAQQAIGRKDKELLKLIVHKFVPNAPTKAELEVSFRPTDDEIEKIREARWDGYSGN